MSLSKPSFSWLRPAPDHSYIRPHQQSHSSKNPPLNFRLRNLNMSKNPKETRTRPLQKLVKNYQTSPNKNLTPTRQNLKIILKARLSFKTQLSKSFRPKTSFSPNSKQKTTKKSFQINPFTIHCKTKRTFYQLRDDIRSYLKLLTIKRNKSSIILPNNRPLFSILFIIRRKRAFSSISFSFLIRNKHDFQLKLFTSNRQLLHVYSSSITRIGDNKHSLSLSNIKKRVI